MSEYGTFTKPGTVRLERLLPGPIERIWAYLTEPDKRAVWLAGGAMELRVGGRVELQFHHADLSAEKTPPPKYTGCKGGVSMIGEVTRCDPPRLLAYTWNNDGKTSEVTFELTPQGSKVLLVITHRLPPDMGLITSVSGGWHAHVGLLMDHLEGREPRPFWSSHATLEAEYARRLAGS
jgi:uncharacterized protein YndB with AHSA1/START domain